MSTKKKMVAVLGGALLLATMGAPMLAMGADHIDLDAAALAANPASDITDLYAWTNGDQSRVNLVLNVNHNAGADGAFGAGTQYVIHANSLMEYGGDATETNIICQFAAADSVSCWVGDPADGGDFVTGDPSGNDGVTSDSGGVQVFAGLRDDPFFMEFTGFTQAIGAVRGAAPTLEFDAAGCPTVDMATSGAVVGLLQGGGTDDMMASDTFDGLNILSIVLSVDKSLLNSGGPILALHATTHSG